MPRSKLTDHRIEVRNSPIHGRGVFAIRPIRPDSTILEYTGERITHEEADERYGGASSQDGHTMLFTVSSKIVIDAARVGSDARYINHSCQGNCRAYIDEGRVYIESRRKIEPGEELSYDYKLTFEEPITKKIRALYACRCGAPKCRGTMLYVPRKRTAKAPVALATASRAKTGARSILQPR